MKSETSSYRLVGLFVVVALPVVGLAYFNSTGGFVWDDIKNLRQAQVSGLSLRYLLAGTSGHFAPGHRLGDWVLERFFPVNFPASQVLLLLGFAATLLLFHRLLVELFGAGPGPVVLTFLYGTSVVHVVVVQWWSSGMDRIPATALGFVSMIAYVRFFKAGSRRALLLSIGAMALALAFYIKPVFIPLYLFLFRVLLLEPERSVRATLRDAVGEWRVWSLYVVPVGVYLVIYVSYYKDAVSTPSVGVLGQYLSTLWLRVVAPGFFGIYLPRLSSSMLTTSTVVAVQVAIVAAAAWSLVRINAARRAWAFFAITFLANAVVVGLTRIGFFGPKFIAYTLYYNLEATYLFVIAFGAVVLRWPPGLVAGMGLRMRRVAPALVGLGAGVYLALGWVGASQVSSPQVWFGRDARSYTDRLQDSVRKLPEPASQWSSVVGFVPPVVVPSFLAPYNAYSEVFPVFEDHIGFDVAGRAVFDVGPDGTAHPVTFMPVVGDDVLALRQSWAVATEPPVAANERDGMLCITSGAGTALTALTPPSPIEGGPLYFALRYTSAQQPLLAWSTQPVGAGPPTTPRLVKLSHGGEQTNLFPLEVPSLRTLYLLLAPHSQFCMRRIEIGQLSPSAP